MSHKEIGLQDLLGRDLVMEWFESVALVQSICRDVLNGGQGTSFPAISGILLRPDGSTSISGPSSEGQAVPSAARLLAEMSGSDLPVQLRLVVSQAAAPGSPYGGLEDFSRALAYFERSEPQQILQGLYARAASAQRRPGDAAQPTAWSAPQPESATPKPPVPAKKRSQMPLVAGLATVAGLSISVWAFGGLPALGQPVTRGMTLFENTLRAKLGAAPVDAPVPDATAPLEQERPSGRSSARAAAGSVAPSQRASAPAPRAASSAPLTGEIPALRRLPAPELQFLPGAVAALGGVPPRFYSTVDIVANAYSAEALAARGQIYSSRDERVIPPRAIYPQLPTAPDGAPRDGQTVVDLIIAPTGQVEGARLRTAPRNIHEFMLLSAAKAWRFDPAVHEDGHPVRFRHSVVITAYP